jgi:hypothetical protein
MPKQAVKIDPVVREAYSVNEFCAVYGICRATLYNAWKLGRGPRSKKFGRRRIIPLRPGAGPRAMRRRHEAPLFDLGLA